MKKMREAVSIVFECKGEIFSIVRQNFLKNFPGYTAFIGGKVDQDDREKAPYNLHLLDDHPHHLINALVRESREEVGIEIDRLIESGVITAVDFIGRAVTPDFNPYRFDTYFFRVSFREKIAFTLDQNEVLKSDWSFPAVVLSEWKSGVRIMVPPVRFFIEELSKNIHFQQNLSFINRFNMDQVVPWIESIHGLIQVMPLSNTVPPAQRTNSFVIGDTLIDPSPKNKQEYEKFIQTISKYDIKKIFITHHHKDHHQMSTQLANDLNVGMQMSQYTHDKCIKVYGKDYFANIAIDIVSDQDLITIWNNEAVLAIAVPGHDEGQLALLPMSKKWMIVGDLFQGVGTVVVGGEEGDMAKYFDTLQKVIDLAPSCVIPSHGIALGGTNILEKTLEHRKFREKQILEMYEEGLSLEQMLKRIYFDIPEKLYKYAKANIESHLEKLSNEKKI